MKHRHTRNTAEDQPIPADAWADYAHTPASPFPDKEALPLLPGASRAANEIHMGQVLDWLEDAEMAEDYLDHLRTKGVEARHLHVWWAFGEVAAATSPTLLRRWINASKGALDEFGPAGVLNPCEHKLCQNKGCLAHRRKQRLAEKRAMMRTLINDINR